MPDCRRRHALSLLMLSLMLMPYASPYAIDAFLPPRLSLLPSAIRQHTLMLLTMLLLLRAMLSSIAYVSLLLRY